MNQKQIEVITGCCLGDISIQFISETTARFQICQSIKHKEYVESKFEILRDLCKTEPKQKDEKYPVIYFNSVGSTELHTLLSKFKCDGIRRVPSDIKDILTPIALTYWFCDDGTSSYVTLTDRLKTVNSNITLCTDRYTMDEVNLLIDALSYKFNIKSSIKSSPSMNGRIRIYIGTKYSQKFFDIVEPFIPKIMEYKIKRPYSIT